MMRNPNLDYGFGLWALQWRAKEHVLQSAKEWSYVTTSATNPKSICLVFTKRSDAEKAAQERGNQGNAEYRVVGLGYGPGTADEILHLEGQLKECREDERQACWEDFIQVLRNGIKDAPHSMALKAMHEAVFLMGWKEVGTGDGKPMHKREKSAVNERLQSA